MKKIIFTILVTISFSFAHGQFGELPYNQVAELKQQTIKVALNEGDPFSSAFKKAVEENWTFTKYEFTTEEKILSSGYEKKDEVFQLGFYKGTFQNSKYVMENVPFIGIVNKIAGKKNYANGKDFNIYFPYPIDGIEEKYLPGYLALNIQLLDNYLKKLGDPNRKTPTLYVYLKNIETKNIECKKKKILICKEDLYAEEADITSTYKFDYEIVSRDKINEAILNKEDVLFYYLVPSLKYSYHLFISAKDGTVLFSNHGFTGDIYFKKAQSKIFKVLGKAK